MRITFVAYDTKDSCGGPFAWAPVFMKQMKDRGAHVEALILTIGELQRSHIADECESVGIPSRILDTRQAITLDDQVEWILRQWAESPCELFIANLVLPALIAGKWVKLAGGKSIGVMHSNPEHDPFYRDFADLFLTQGRQYQLSGCVAVSQHILKTIRNRLDAQGTSMVVIPCGAALPDCRATFSNSPFRVVYCGRLEQEQKRVRDVVVAMQKITEAYESVTCSIFGAGSEEDWIRAAIAGNSRILFRGKVPARQIQQEMCQHQAILLLSDYEGLPIALVEGMLAGLVPICYNEPSGAGEVISDGCNGLLVADREQGTVRAIGQLLIRDTWQRLSNYALETSNIKYSYPVVMNQWWSYLSHLYGGNTLETDRIPATVALRGTIPDGLFEHYAICRKSGEDRPKKLYGSWRHVLRRLVKKFGV